MGLVDLFWLFIVFTSLQPLFRQRVIQSARKKLISGFENTRRSRVILLVHRQETMSFLGFPVMRYIDVNDSEEVLRAIQLTEEDVPLDIILHTPGGLVLATLQIARALKRHPAKITVFIPHYAMSGGTLIALAADEIVMSPSAVLGPLDPQVGKYPAPSLLKLVEEKPAEAIDDETMIYADVAKKATQQLQEAIVELLEDRVGSEKAGNISKMLTEGRWTHDYPINPAEAKELGLPVSTEMPDEVYQLMALYSQPVRHRQTVDYIPEPRTRRSETAKS